MKIKPFTIALLIMLAALVIYIFFGVIYLKQQREQEALTSQLAQLNLILEKRHQDSDELRHTDELKRWLIAARAMAVSKKTSFPTRLSSTEVLNAILQMAQESQVKTLPLRTQPISVKKVGEHIYNVLRLNVKVEGSFPELLTFLDKLEGRALKTLALDRASITRTPESWIASLDLSIYALSLPTSPSRSD